MDNIHEIDMDCLSQDIPKYPIGTLLVCKKEDKIYAHLCTPESINKPIWIQLTSDYELEMKFKSQSTVEKVKWLLANSKPK